MILVPCFLTISVILGVFDVDLQKELFPWTSKMHALCLQWVNRGSELDFIYRSLVCGHRLPEGSFYESLRVMGLLHLMVISGTHLLFLEKILSRLLFWLSPSSFFKRTFIVIILGLYAGIGSLKPPVVRAFLSLIVSQFNRSWKCHWPGHQRAFITGSLCLALFPHWGSSYSLILSWGASLSLSLAKGFRREIWCFLLLYPLLLPLAPQALTNLFFHWVFSPFLSYLLFPLSLFVSLFPDLRFIGDGLWKGVDFFFSILRLSLPPLGEGIRIPLFFLWLYLISLHFLVYFVRVYWKRSQFSKM